MNHFDANQNLLTIQTYLQFRVFLGTAEVVKY